MIPARLFCINNEAKKSFIVFEQSRFPLSIVNRLITIVDSYKWEGGGGGYKGATTISPDFRPRPSCSCPL